MSLSTGEVLIIQIVKKFQSYLAYKYIIDGQSYY